MRFKAALTCTSTKAIEEDRANCETPAAAAAPFKVLPEVFSYREKCQQQPQGQQKEGTGATDTRCRSSKSKKYKCISNPKVTVMRPVRTASAIAEGLKTVDTPGLHIPEMSSLCENLASSRFQQHVQVNIILTKSTGGELRGSPLQLGGSLGHYALLIT